MSSTPESGETSPAAGRETRRRRDRFPLEGPLTRVMTTAGIVGIGVAIAAIMTSQHSQGWLIGLVVSIVSVLLGAIVWRSRRL